jgi:hypothetical protein
MNCKFKVGDRVHKPNGYTFIGTIVSVFTTTAGEIRVVAELHNNGMLHIFSESQLEIGWPNSNDPWKEVIHLAQTLPNDHDFGRAVRLHYWESRK